MSSKIMVEDSSQMLVVIFLLCEILCAETILCKEILGNTLRKLDMMKSTVPHTLTWEGIPLNTMGLTSE